MIACFKASIYLGSWWVFWDQQNHKSEIVSLSLTWFLPKFMRIGYPLGVLHINNLITKKSSEGFVNDSFLLTFWLMIDWLYDSSFFNI